jgi:hypothetical protein
MKIKIKLKEVQEKNPMYNVVKGKTADDKKALANFFGGAKRIIQDINLDIPFSVGQGSTSPDQFSSFFSKLFSRNFKDYERDNKLKPDTCEAVIKKCLKTLNNLRLNVDLQSNKVTTYDNRTSIDPNFPSRPMKYNLEDVLNSCIDGTSEEFLNARIFNKLDISQENKNFVDATLSKIFPNEFRLFKTLKDNYFSRVISSQIIGKRAFIVYSRVPIDVLRMSDFKNLESCHSMGGAYDYCALEEAESEGGAIAYLFTGDLSEDMISRIESGKEFMIDLDREETSSEDMLRPISRIRLRSFKVDQAYDLIVNTPEIYGLAFEEFFNAVRQVARAKQEPVISHVTQKYGSYLSKLGGPVVVQPLGGTYTDTPFEDMLKQFFGIERDAFFRILAKPVKLTSSEKERQRALGIAETLDKKYNQYTKDILGPQIEDEYVESIVAFEVQEDDLQKVKFDLVLTYKLATHISAELRGETTFNQSVAESLTRLFKEKLDDMDMLYKFTPELEKQVARQSMEIVKSEDFNKLISKYNRLAVNNKMISFTMSGNSAVLEQFPEPEMNEIFKQGVEQLKDLIDDLEEPRNYPAFAREVFKSLMDKIG